MNVSLAAELLHASENWEDQDRRLHIGGGADGIGDDDPSGADRPRVDRAVVTSLDLDQQDRERLLQQTEVILSKESLSREIAIRRIRDALRKADVGSNRTNHLSS